MMGNLHRKPIENVIGLQSDLNDSPVFIEPYILLNLGVLKQLGKLYTYFDLKFVA